MKIDANRAVLAPMAGTADRAFRELCMEQGASFCCSEMVSAMGIFCGDRKSGELMSIAPAEQPCGVQLFGHDPHTFQKAAEAALRHNPAFLDLNMGCPAHKVAGHGSGAALMRVPALAQKIVRATVQAVAGAVPVSVKMRTGWEDSVKNAPELARVCEAEGVAWLTVHGRTRQQMYAPPIDYETIRAVKAAVALPVIANGDVHDGPSAANTLMRTGCDAVMVGRAAQGRPWVFAQIAAFLAQPNAAKPLEVDTQARLRLMLRHVRLLCAYKGERVGLQEARKHAAWYLKGIRGGAKLRQRAVTITSVEELEALAEECLQLTNTC
ncbi:MAG: tRNA dihydrouridine synthase DusB [Oscillospiraceae bacterium]|jgi:nifR3 family TIM-barrel protein|nr:tRNA dihydrouridine synthase DusB [Oscillospiraceae bacterium]